MIILEIVADLQNLKDRGSKQKSPCAIARALLMDMGVL
jgi:hypothetical protein